MGGGKLVWGSVKGEGIVSFLLVVASTGLCALYDSGMGLLYT